MKKGRRAWVVGSLLVFLSVAPYTARHSWGLVGVFLTPITFYGKVVDQHGKPIEAATVTTIAQDTLLGHGTDRVLYSDAAGLFTLSGAHGSGLLVIVSKEGYHQLTDLQGTQYHMPPSQKGFAYGWDPGDGIHKPDKANPQVFINGVGVRKATF